MMQRSRGAIPGLRARLTHFGALGIPEVDETYGPDVREDELAEILLTHLQAATPGDRVLLDVRREGGIQ